MEICQDYRVLNIIYIIKIILKIITIIVPIILIIFTSKELISGITSKDEKNILNNRINNCIKKIIAAILIFLMPTLINITLRLLSYTSWTECYNNATKEIIEVKKEQEKQKNEDKYNEILDNVNNSNPPSIGNIGNDSNNNNNGSDNNNPGSGTNVNKNDLLEIHFIVTGYNDDAILIRTNNKTIMIDGGRIQTKDKVVGYLKDLNVTKIDALIGSHLHYNHIQTQSAILENFAVDKIYYGQDLKTCKSSNYCNDDDQKYILDTINKLNKQINIIKVKDTIYVGNIKIFVVSPFDFKTFNEYSYPENYNSLNFILTYGSNKFMFTGDGIQETSVLNTFDKSILDVDVLKYPHHGNASIGTNYLNTLSPKYVIVPNYNYGKYPSSDMKSKISNAGAKLYEQSTGGNIVLISDGTNIEVKTNQSASSYAR